MKIAYISFEHPYGIACGGIGTYIGQITKLMAVRGHEVEVFSAAPADVKIIKSFNIDGYLLHLIPAQDRDHFRQTVAPFFAQQQQSNGFDLIESPEYGADALFIKKQFLEIPLTIKLHTPSFLTSKLNNYKNTFFDKARYIIGGLLLGKIVKPYWTYNKKKDIEYELYNLADSVSSPSVDLARIITEKWGSQKKIDVLPYPFVPTKELANIKSRKISETVVVTFIGRLEKRKGVFNLMHSIRIILKKNKNILFRFIGKSHPSPVSGIEMEQYISEILSDYKSNIQFLGAQPYSKIPEYLDQSDICIFPSLWENFPNVCLEAMIAGKAVIGSNAGGMADMIKDGINGSLIKPHSPKHIASTILKLVADPSLIYEQGIAARKSVIENYNADLIGKLTEDFYLSILKNNN